MIPYRTRKFLRSLLIGLTALVLAAAALLVCWMLWLGRYVVYTEDGVKLDFSLNPQFPQGVAPEKPGQAPSVDIHFNAGQNGPQLPAELVSFRGYYVTVQDLIDDFDTTITWLQELPEGSTIALQVKDVQGHFYYNSSLGRKKDSVNISKMEQVIRELVAKGHYLIARLPAFQDRYFFLDNERERVPYGLAQDGGNGSLWDDKKNEGGACYWFNPETDGCMSYLIQIITELKALGFREVILDDFRFPNTSMIKYDPDDQPEALNNAAATLVRACATDSFAVSFACRDTNLVFPEGRTRLFLTGVLAADAAAMADKTSFADKATHVGFLTDLHDTRFDNYCVLRPIIAAQE